MVIWLIGLSGAGKTTIGRRLHGVWQAQAANTVFIDGDEVRELFKHDRGPEAYTLEGRRVNAERIRALCALLDRQGINVVCCILSLFPDLQAENRTLFSRYFEVFIDTPLDVVEARDVKGLYAAARRGDNPNMVGVDLVFPRPSLADLVISDATDPALVDDIARRILTKAQVIHD